MVVVDNEVKMWWHDHVDLNVHALVVGIVVVDVLVRVVFVETMTMTTMMKTFQFHLPGR